MAKITERVILVIGSRASIIFSKNVTKTPATERMSGGTAAPSGSK